MCVQMTILSSLEKVFPGSDVSGLAYTGFSMLRNERASFQAAYTLNGSADLYACLEIESPLSAHIRAYEVQLIPGGRVAPDNADDDYITKEGGLFPDLLMPIDGRQVTLHAGGTHAFWFSIKADDVLPPGDFDVTIRLTQNRETLVSATLHISVIDALLPAQTLLHTNWFHTDCLATHYHADVFSEEYWRIVENYLRCAHDFGMNMVLTPLFTPPLDTQVCGERPTVQLVDVTVTGEDSYSFGFEKFDRWAAMALRCGMEIIEVAHFFTQWGAEHAPKIIASTERGMERIFGWETDAAGESYRAFLRQFAAAFIRHVEALGLRDRIILHVSDEPSEEQLPAYRRASAMVHEFFPGFRIVDALSDFSYYQQKLVDTPIPANDHIEPFIGHVPELWTYYCCAQGSGHVSNRFFAMPSFRNRVLGYQLYKFNATGFLHWGFNFWYTQQSVREVDPFSETDAGGAFSAGDAFVVYPADNGTPLTSLRLHVFYDGLQDMRALQLLETRIGRTAVLRLLEVDAAAPLTFSEYPRSARWLLETREKINRAIREN